MLKGKTVTRLGVIGTGKTGAEVIAKALKSPYFELVAVFCSPFNNKRGMDVCMLLNQLTPTGITIESSDRLPQILLELKMDVMIDFSTPQASLINTAIIAKSGIPLIIGTTGFDKIQLGKIKQYAQKFSGCVVHAPNLADGINEMILLSKIEAIISKRPHINIHDSHQYKKADKPSGTSRLLEKELNEINQRLGKNFQVTQTSVRAGNHPSEHTVSFIGLDDKLAISTEIFSSNTYVLNVLEIASLSIGKIGFLSVWDLLGFTEVEIAINNFLQQYKIAKLHAS